MTGQIRSLVQTGLIGSMAAESGMEHNLQQMWNAARGNLMPCKVGGPCRPPFLTGLMQQEAKKKSACQRACTRFSAWCLSSVPNAREGSVRLYETLHANRGRT